MALSSTACKSLALGSVSPAKPVTAHPITRITNAAARKTTCCRMEVLRECQAIYVAVLEVHSSRRRGAAKPESRPCRGLRCLPCSADRRLAELHMEWLVQAFSSVRHRLAGTWDCTRRQKRRSAAVGGERATQSCRGSSRRRSAALLR